MKPATLFGKGLAVVLFSASPVMLTDAPSQPRHDTHFADAYDQAALVAGKVIYMHACARCHGHSLQGQPLWQMDGDALHRRAPAQDDTGHTWQHSDEAIFQIVKQGRFSDTRQDVVPSMPAFGARLSDKDILDVISFIKARWSIGLRAAQATLNPGMAGMPSEASRVEWTLPPICAATQRQWRATSK